MSEECNSHMKDEVSR